MRSGGALSNTFGASTEFAAGQRLLHAEMLLL
jgi:hypothetical protein